MQVMIISGQAKSGKSLVCKMIADAMFQKGYIPVIDNFAAPIKEEASRGGLDPFRLFCQDYGRMKREEDPAYFVKKAAERLSTIAKEEAADIEEGRKHWERVVIFDDCRYPNECKFAKATDAILLFVTRGDKLPDKKASWREHESETMSRIVDSSGFETHFDEVFDVFLINDGTKKQLKKLINSRIDDWLSANQPSFGDCGEDECDCPLCEARRSQELPDPRAVLDYIIRKLTGEDLH